MTLTKVLLIILCVYLIIFITIQAFDTNLLPLSPKEYLMRLRDINFNFTSTINYFEQVKDAFHAENNSNSPYPDTIFENSANYWSNMWNEFLKLFGGGTNETKPTNIPDGLVGLLGITYGFIFEPWENILPFDEVGQGVTQLIGLPFMLLSDTTVIVTSIFDVLITFTETREIEGWKPAIDLDENWFDEKYNIPAVTP